MVAKLVTFAILKIEYNIIIFPSLRERQINFQ
jgi:hypothetical protein